jgi:hypothetical protein
MLFKISKYGKPPCEIHFQTTGKTYISLLQFMMFDTVKNRLEKTDTAPRIPESTLDSDPDICVA